jgi:hypothetical protein
MAGKEKTAVVQGLFSWVLKDGDTFAGCAGTHQY